MNEFKDLQRDNAQIHDEIENISANTSGNRPFAEVLESNLSRRGVMKGSLTAAAGAFLAPAAFAGWNDNSKWNSRNKSSLVEFEPVTVEQYDAQSQGGKMPVISEDYSYDVLIPWGTPIEPGATEEYDGDPGYRPTSEQAEKQIGLGHDGMWFFPEDINEKPYGASSYRLSSKAGMLCVNHEYGTNFHVLGKGFPESLEDVRLSQAIHGVSVVALEKRAGRYGKWEVVSSPNSRRITGNTPMDFSGPAADSEHLVNPAGNIPLGTLNNCGSGPTLWGTYLTCEENFNGYFGYAAGYARTESQQRYGFAEGGFGYGWHMFDKRFDISEEDYTNECNRFGWVVEIDPMDGTRKPVKRTALGRFKHEAICMKETAGTGSRIACYMGDDQRGDYCYKYLSNDGWKETISKGESPLDHGALYVAKLKDDGSGEWLLLDISVPALAAKFASQAEVLIHARIAADIVGATPMDRPEWSTIGKDGSVYWTLTNNTRKDDGQGEVNAANPEAENVFGHIINTRDADNGLGTTFEWEIFIRASNSQGTEMAFGSPDAAYADEDGRLIIGTDGGQGDVVPNDQLTVFDTTANGPRDTSGNPIPSRLLIGVNSDEITGWTHTPDNKTAFTNIQHPGNGDPSRTNFPASPDGTTIPRDCTLVITRKRSNDPVGA